MFLLASAVVSFRGWPQVGAQATPVAVSAGRLRAPRSSPPVRQFVALASAQTASVANAGAAGTGPTGRPGSRQNATAIVAATPVGSGAPHRASFVSSSPSASGTSRPPTTPPCSSCGRPTLGSTLGGVTQAASTTLGPTVAATGTQLGSVASGLTGAVASQLGAVNPKLSQVVSGTGEVLGGTVSSATAALGSTLSGVGRGLSGLLARHR